MLTKKQVLEIREHLERAQRPLFFFDNDQDGLCSFLLLQRYIEHGKGVPIKSYPQLDKSHFRRVHELKADYIFILDKPLVSREFFNEAEKFNIPVVWIDHHEVAEDEDFEEVPKFVSYYNPASNKNPSTEPVTALCYQISKRKEDSWIGVAGCIADKYMPEFYKEFKKKYPELSLKEKDAGAFDIYYKSGIGRISRMLGYGLKDRTTNVVKMMKFLMKARGPHDVLEETNKNKTIHKRFEQLDSKYQKLLKKAVNIGEESSERLLFFQYGGDLSISSDLASELYYLFPKKLICVIYIRGLKANLSIRGKKAKAFLLRSIKDIGGSRGGGHEEAVGGQIQVSDLEEFRENLEKIVTKK